MWWLPSIQAIKKVTSPAWDALRKRLMEKYPPPLPTDITIFHHHCGGEVDYVIPPPANEDDPIDLSPNRAVCKRATYDHSKLNKIGGCGGVWLASDLNKATDDDLRAWFFTRDEGQYKLVLVDRAAPGEPSPPSAYLTVKHA
jgi:hypothetical protein